MFRFGSEDVESLTFMIWGIALQTLDNMALPQRPLPRLSKSQGRRAPKGFRALRYR